MGRAPSQAEADEAAIVEAMRGFAAQDRAADAGSVAAVAGLPLSRVREGVKRLRMAGKVTWIGFALSPSMMEEPAEVEAAEPAPSVALRAPPPPAGEDVVAPPVEVDRLGRINRRAVSAEVLAAFREEVRDYLDGAPKGTTTRLGKEAGGNSNFANSLRNGTRVGQIVVDRVRAWMAANPLPAPPPGPAAETDKERAERRRAANRASQAPERVAARAVEREAGAAEIEARRGEGERARARHVAEQVAAEAEAAGRNRRLARSTGGLVSGAQIDVAHARLVERIQTGLAEQPEDVMTAMRRRWPEIWENVVHDARELGVLPFGHMMEAVCCGLIAMREDRREAAA